MAIFSTRGLAAAAVLTIAATAAQAVAPNTVPAANRLYMSGATATDSILRNLFLIDDAAQRVCQAGTIDVYEGTAQVAIFCTGNVSGVSGTPIGFFKESVAGSGNGVGPVANQTNLVFLDADTATGCSAPAVVPAANGLIQYTRRTGCTSTTARPPQAGISDVEPRLLGATATQQANLSSNGVLGVVFAPAISLNLYRALQTAQGLGNDDTGANMPSLTTAQVRALFNGNYVDWSQFDDLAGSVPADSQVYICRRGNSSGTQASFETFLLNQRCTDGVQGFLTPTTASCLGSGCGWNATTFGNDLIFAGGGTGDVRNCLDNKDDTGRWAIGVISTENTYNNTDREFRYIRLDGELPTLERVANGAYPFFTENTINRRLSALSGPPLTVIDYIRNNLGLPALVANVNQPFQVNAHGDGGVVSVPNFDTIVPNPSLVTQAAMRTNPVNGQTRGGNNCAPPSTTANTQSSGS